MSTSETRLTEVQPAALDVKGAAKYLAISVRKLDELQADGYIEPCRFGRKRVFRVSDLDALLERASFDQIG